VVGVVGACLGASLGEHTLLQLRARESVLSQQLP
jgi:hypothetical protein